MIYRLFGAIFAITREPRKPSRQATPCKTRFRATFPISPSKRYVYVWRIWEKHSFLVYGSDFWQFPDIFKKSVSHLLVSSFETFVLLELLARTTTNRKYQKRALIIVSRRTIFGWKHAFFRKLEKNDFLRQNLRQYCFLECTIRTNAKNPT